MKLDEKDKYHLPHNSIRVDEFYHMLNCIDLSKEYYLYDELRLLFLKKQIEDNKLQIFHKQYYKRLLNNKDINVSNHFKNTIKNPSVANLKKLLDCQYSEKKTFKQIFNETVRDYTEFFAFLGLLPTYYKGKKGGEKKHYVSDWLKLFMSNKMTIEELLLNFKYRNSSKDYDSLTMYQIMVRPFVVALKALRTYFEMGYTEINNKIISAIVIYSKDEHIDKLVSLFYDPTKDIKDYDKLFTGDFKKISDELGRATLFLSPYLLELKYIGREGKNYVLGTKNFDELKVTDQAAFCNSYINNISLTPLIGKILYTLYRLSRMSINKIKIKEVFDHNIILTDKQFLIDELIKLRCIYKVDKEFIYIGDFKYQYAINPYTDFFDIDDANYVESIQDVSLNYDDFTITTKDTEITNKLQLIKPLALGSDGEKYEEAFYKLLKENFNIFDVKWLGANSVGKRLSDIIIKVDVFDGLKTKKIGIVVECKAGKSVRAFDERKEIDDIVNTLKKEKNSLDGIWYWVVNGDALPNVDEHGGYRTNDLSKSFMEKLLDIQFSIGEYMRIPTIVTAFSFDAISNYISYLYDLTHTLSSKTINKIDVPHFWRWSKKFMNLQYVMVHKELRLNL